MLQNMIEKGKGPVFEISFQLFQSLYYWLFVLYYQGLLTTHPLPIMLKRVSFSDSDKRIDETFDVLLFTDIFKFFRNFRVSQRVNHLISMQMISRK